MNSIIKVEHLGKQYRTGALQAGYTTFREMLAGAMTSNLKRLRGEMGGHSSSARDEKFWALQDINFEIAQGDVVGLVGRNGAGKSTLLKILSRIVEPTVGRYELYGRVGSLLEIGTGFHPELSGRDNIYLNGAVLGMKRSEIARKFDEIVAFSEIEEFIDTPVKWYSSGMYLRLAFSVAVHLEPEILIMDEVLAVGDVAFQHKCLEKMHAIMQQGRTIIFVSHNMPAVARLCRRVILMDRGRIVHDGPSQDVINAYLGSSWNIAARREWHALNEAPGNDIVRLWRVRLCTEDGRSAEAFDIRRPIGIEIVYETLEPGHILAPVCHFYNREGLHVFAAQDMGEEWRRRPRPLGRYTSTAWIPGNYLAEGSMNVDVGINSYVPRETVHFLERQVVGFEVFDNHEGDSARGDYKGSVPGVVRPLLEWTTAFSARSKTSETVVEEITIT